MVAAAPLLGLLVDPGLLKRPLLELLRRHATFVLAGVAFVAFVIVNDGVAMAPAEQEKHPLGLYWGNLAFLLITAPLVALPLADATAIFFVSPLIITAFSVLFLGETVGPRRWAAVAVGLAGVLVIVRPTSESFQFAALLSIQ